MIETSADPFVIRNARLVATFDPATGRLLTLSDTTDRTLFSSCIFRYRVAGKYYSDAPQNGEKDDAPAIVTRTVSLGSDRVRSIAASEHLRITRDFFVPRDRSLIRMRTAVRALQPLIKIAPVSLPLLNFGPGVEDPLGDERDHYFDGCELSNGVELPSWRVLFNKKDDDGIFIATICREFMAKLQILPEGLEFAPHRNVLYTMDQHARFPPLSMQPGQVIRHEIWFGAWSKATHDSLIGELKLDVPRRRRVAPLAHVLPPASPHGHVIALASADAPTTSANEPFDAGAWRVIDAAWSHNGKALFAPTVAFPPALQFTPGLTGNHRVLVTIGAASAPLLRIDGKPIYRTITAFNGSPFVRVLSGTLPITVVDFGVHQFSSETVLTLERTPERHDNTMAAEIRLVSTDAPVRVPRAGALPLHSFIDAPDIGMLLTDCRNPSIEPYHEVIRQHARMGFSTLLWRIDGQVTEYPTNVATRRYTYGKVHGVYNPQCKEGGRIQRRVDMLREAIDTARSVGLKIVGWMRFNSYWGNVQSDFFRENPQFWETWENGSVGRKLCLAHPAVRAHKRAILLEAARYGLDGLNLGFLRHPPMLHRAPILVESYRQRFGEDPPLNSGPGNIDFANSLPPTDDKSLRWFRHRADFLTEFVRELKRDLRDAGLSHVPVSIWVRPNHCLFDGIDLETWLKEGLCDAVYSESAVGDPVGEPTPEWETMVRARVPLIRGLSAFKYESAAKNLGPFLDKYDGVSIYEGNVAVVSPNFIHLFETELARRYGN